jgi:hypothetical protein
MMKQQLLTLAMVSSTIISSFAQVTMSKTLPPFGTKYKLGQSASATLAQPTLGADQVWDYSSETISALYTYTITDPTTVNQEFQDSCPTAKYVEILAIPGAPSPDLNPMEFMKDDGDYLIRVGEKGSGSGINTTYDTVFKFNQTFQTTEVYHNDEMTYAGYGSLKIKSTTYSDVALMLRTRTGSPDTSYIFYTFTPHFHRLAALGWTGGASAGLTFWEPLASNTGLKNLTLANTSIYPVPATTALNIELDRNAQTGTAIVSTMEGKEVLKSSFEGPSHSIDIQSLHTGLYFITIMVDGQTLTRKFTKN